MSTLRTRAFSSVPTVAPWAVATTFLLSLAGLAISTYLTIVHFDTAVVLTCPATGGVINCAKVTTSAQSHFLGMPVAVLGLANYLAMTILNSPWVWKRPERWIATARFVLAFIGMAFVLWLIAAEVLIIGNICLWCTAVHLVTFTLLVVLTRVAPRQLGWGTYER
jgi:uncharacterized membrane protein